MPSAVRIILIALLWLALLAAIAFWFNGRDVTRLTIAAGPASGDSFELAEAIARVVEESYPRVKVDVYETQGSGENIRLVDADRVDLGVIQADSSITVDVRAVATLYSDAFQLVVTTESGIQSVADLAGRRVAIPPADSGQNRSFWFLIRHYGIQPDQLTALAMSDEAANFAMQQGQVEAVFRVRAPGNRLVRELVRDQANMRLVPIDQPAALSLKQPTINAGQIPRGSYRGFPALPVTDLQTAVVDRLLIARTDLDPGLVYKLTKLLFEQRAALVGKSNIAGFIRPLGDADQISIPMHDGARRYYDREKPSLLQENSRIAATALYVCALLTSVGIALRSRIKRVHRVRFSDYNKDLMQIADQARDAQPGDNLAPLQDQLIDILRTVVRDLDADRVTKEEFDHFSFTWQAVDTLVRDRTTRPVVVTAGETA
jgi:TRAP transporter TAXI family solute receptor